MQYWNFIDKDEYLIYNTYDLREIVKDIVFTSHKIVFNSLSHKNVITKFVCDFIFMTKSIYLFYNLHILFLETLK